MQLLPEGMSSEEITTIAASPVDDAGIERLLRVAVSASALGALGGEDEDFRISLAGAQDYRLTPLYDVLSAWPVVGARLAMALHATNTDYRISETRARHFVDTARACGFAGMPRI